MTAPHLRLGRQRAAENMSVRTMMRERSSNRPSFADTWWSGLSDAERTAWRMRLTEKGLPFSAEAAACMWAEDLYWSSVQRLHVRHGYDAAR
jgi:hypothetical protein